MRTFALVVNSADLEGYQGVYRNFLNDHELGEEDDIRIVCMNSGHFAVLSKELFRLAPEARYFGAEALFRALDSLHRTYRLPDYPETNTWTTEDFLAEVTLPPDGDGPKAKGKVVEVPF